MTENELIIKAIQNEEKAFEIIVERYKTMVYKICFGFIHNTDDANDIAQDVFVEVFQSLPKFKNASKFSTWIYRIAVNKSINFLRSVKRRQWIQAFENILYSKNYEENEPVATENMHPGYAIENKERAAELYKAIETLPEKQRIAFTLHNFDDLPYKEIAAVMHTSLPSVESLIHRAKINLQKKLIYLYH
ncbi:MAG: RNA polymerase sigma factor [Lentimicrobiaceae bacterium]|nr:RNA polymerase sigma factor [Lentimicrobiaceae bacterium]